MRSQVRFYGLPVQIGKRLCGASKDHQRMLFREVAAVELDQVVDGALHFLHDHVEEVTV